MNPKICQMVTDRIIASLDAGICPWRKPWTGGASVALNYTNLRPYSLLNQMLLAPGEYVSYKQARDKGGQVKKGAKGSPIVFWKWLRYTDSGKLLGDDDCFQENEKRVPYLRYYTVFNIKDCEGLEPHDKEELPKGAAADLDAEKVLVDYVTREKIKLNRDELSSQAYYSPSRDEITIPRFDQYESTAEYYSTAFHECVHSTGTKSRLNRFDESNPLGNLFGSDSYSKEELVAEMGSAFLVNSLGLESDGSFKNSAAYIGNWRNHIKKDNQLVVLAAGKAEKAFRFILNLEPETKEN